MKSPYSILLIILITSLVTLGQVPQTTSFQGLLTNSDGSVVSDGSYSLNFKLYDAATSGTMLWEETQAVSTTGGVFNVILGKVTVLVLQFDKPYWLEMSIDGGAALSPRVEFTSSFYSLMSKSVEDSTVSTAKLQDNAVTTEKLTDGAVTQAKLHSGVSLPPGGTAGGDLVGDYPNPSIAENAVNGTKVTDNTLTSDDIATNLLSSIDGVINDGGDVDLVAGSNITITPDNEANTVTISADGVGGGDITSVTAGAGLTGGGSSGDLVINTGKGAGISVSADEVSLDTTFSDGRYVNEGQANSVTSAMVTNNTLTSADISSNIISSLDGVVNDGGNVDLVEGSNITITPNDGANTITIATTSSGDNLGNHTATQNVKLNNHWLSGDGGNEGVFVSADGNVGIATDNPSSLYKLHVMQSTDQLGKAAIFGHATVSPPTSFGGYGIYGLRSSDGAGGAGVFGEASGGGHGVYGLTDDELDGSAIYGVHTTGGYAGYFLGKGYFSGNLGIGIATPQQKLHVDGLARFDVTDNAQINISTPEGWPGLIAFTPNGHRRDIIFDNSSIRLLTSSTSSSPSGANGITIIENGNVGIGTTNPQSMLSVGGDGFPFYKLSVSSDMGGVFGEATNSGDVENYGGVFRAFGNQGQGVHGLATGGYGRGVYGEASGTSGRGVEGVASNTGEVANHGGYFEAAGKSGRGVEGVASNTGDVTNFGGAFFALGKEGYGVYGYAFNYGEGRNYGGAFRADGSSGRGVYGNADGTYGIGIYGEGTYYAGYFLGDARVTGNLQKGGGSFLIDHPLDPENKNLSHSFVESPDMMNIYNGNVTTDGNGNADVELPEWFEALNRDFRYQLTVIGEFAQAIVSQKISNNRFSIKTDKPNVEVSWQVTGIRQDAFANANRIPVEEVKNPEDRGKYLHPKAFGMPESMGVDYDEKHEKER
ncbi:MAG: hypothetical protein ABFS12_12965, partial [Bacteroidota bacterium]